MRRSKSVAIGTAFLTAVAMDLAGSSDAQPSAVTEESFLRAALIVTTFTKLEDACHKSHGFSPQQSTHCNMAGGQQGGRDPRPLA